MSSTLTWKNSGLGVKNGTTTLDFFTDFKSLVESHASDPEYLWQVASSDLTGTPYFVNLKRKDGSPGRILLLGHSSSWVENEAIFNGPESVNIVYITYFPAGNVDTPSNLNQTSGTVMGDDTGALYVNGSSINSIYGGSRQVFYFESEAGVVVVGQQPTSTTGYMIGAGDLVVDELDNAYPCSFGYQGSTIGTFGGATSPMAWRSTDALPNNLIPAIRANYNGDNRLFFHAYAPTGWGTSTGASDMLVDEAENKAWFAPVPLLGQTKGEGFALKYRQIAFGPASTVDFDTYEDGGIVRAAQLCANTSGSAGAPWVTNFKV